MDKNDKELMEQWFLIRNISPGTQKVYKIAIRYYSDVIDKSISELIEEAEKEQETNLKPRKRRVNLYLLKYKKWLEGKNIAPGTINLYFTAIKSFYIAFDITVSDIKMDRGDIGLEKNIGKPLTTEDILKLVNVATPREKALIYLMALSGMGQQEARDLTLKKFMAACSEAINREVDDVYDLFKNESKIQKEILTLIITRKKVKYQHHTFIPPETSREIIIYLKERCYSRNENIRIKSNQDPIFVDYTGKKLRRDSVVSNFRRTGQKAGFTKEKGSYSYWRSHALRKYFISTIINKTGEKIIADYLAGHKINDQDRIYWRVNPEDLKQHYLKALPYLSIDEAQVRNIRSEDYLKLKEESKKKDEKIRNMEEKMKLMDKILKEMMENQLRSDKSR